MEVCILSIGKINTPWIEEGLKQFEQRIKRYIKFSTLILPDLKNAKSLSKDEIKEEEGKLIIKALSTSDQVVLLDERGKEFTSREFASWINKNMISGKKRLLFIIGGPYGFSEQVYAAADYKIALSEMTFTHEMAKLLLTEQIYRGFTILNGEPYHHD